MAPIRRGLVALLMVTVPTGIAACSSPATAIGGQSARASSAAGASSPVTKLAVSSTLDGRSRLPLRLHWRATANVPDAQVSEVDYLIDGRLAWVERNAPYFYGDDGNWLVTSFLRAGVHTFQVKVVTVAGAAATDTVKAAVSAAPPPPAALDGSMWTRVVTAADQAKATSGQPPPTGRWRLRIVRAGWQLNDSTSPNQWGLFDVVYLHRGALQMRPTIEYPPYPNSNNGGFCGDTDPLATWTYRVTTTSLTLKPAASDPCGDRIAILAGTWTKAS